MPEDYAPESRYSDIFGEEPAAEEAPREEEAPQEETAEPAAEPEPEEEEAEEAPEPEEEEEGEESPRKGNVTKALKAAREARRADRARYEAQLAEYQKLLSDPRFLEHQARKLQEQAAQPPQAPEELPDAPFYPNTAAGQARMVRDQERATDLLGELASDPKVLTAVKGYVKFDGMDYVEAAREALALASRKADSFRREGREAAEESVAKRSRMTTEARPQAGIPSERARLEKAAKSGSESQRLDAGAVLLGLD
jgi:hypothetical protein